MQSITRIAATNFRFKQFDFMIPPTLLLHGKNGSGKSSIIDSIILAQSGYLPQYGKQASKCMIAAREGRMALSLHTNKGIIINREFSGTRLRATSNVVTFPGGATGIEAEQAINTAVGNCIYSFNLDEFLSLSAQKARQYIFSLINVDSEEFTRDSFIFDHPVIAKGFPEGMTIQDGVLASIVYGKSQKSILTKKLKGYEATQKELAERAAELSEIPGQIKKKKAEQDELIKELPEVQILIERAKMPDTIKQWKKEFGALTDYFKSVDIEKLETALAEIEKKYEKAPQGFEESQKLIDAKANVEALNIKFNQLQAINVFDGSLKPGHVCVTCKTELSEEHIKMLKGSRFKFARELNDTNQQLEDAVKLRDNLQEQHVNQNKSAFEYKIRLEERIKNGKAEIKRQKQEFAEKEKRIIELTRNLETQDDNKGQELTSLEDLENQKKTIQDKIKTLKGEIEQLTRQKETMGNLDDANVKAKDCKAEIENLKTDLKSAAQELTRILEASIGPFIDDVNKILHEVDESFVFYLDLISGDKTIFEMGWNREGVKVPFEGLSNGEKALFGLAFQCAIIQKENPELKILLADNIERLSGTNRSAFVNAGCKLVDKKILGNFIAAGAIEKTDAVLLNQQTDIKCLCVEDELTW